MKKEYFLILLAIFTIKSIVFQNSFSDGFIYLVFCGYLILDKYLKFREINKEYFDKVNSVENILTKKIDSVEQSVEKVRASTDSVKVAMGFTKPR